MRRAEEPGAPGLSLEDTIRLLEGHVRSGTASREVQIQAAIRLAEIYRLNKRDPARAREVLAVVGARFPDVPELWGADDAARGHDPSEGQ